jgi:hypothetical protein
MTMFPRLPLLLALTLAAATAFVPAQKSLAFRPSSSLQVAVDTSEIKNGMTVEIDNEPYKVLSFSIMKQARGAAKTTIKFKNLMRGNTIENTYRSGEKFETAMIEKKDVIFSYEDGVSTVIMCGRSMSVEGSLVVFCLQFLSALASSATLLLSLPLAKLLLHGFPIL